jgi:hypothetical protein
MILFEEAADESPVLPFLFLLLLSLSLSLSLAEFSYPAHTAPV